MNSVGESVVENQKKKKTVDGFTTSKIQTHPVWHIRGFLARIRIWEMCQTQKRARVLFIGDFGCRDILRKAEWQTVNKMRYLFVRN